MGHGTGDMGQMSHNVPKCPLRRGGDNGTRDMGHGFASGPHSRFSDHQRPAKCGGPAPGGVVELCLEGQAGFALLLV